MSELFSSPYERNAWLEFLNSKFSGQEFFSPPHPIGTKDAENLFHLGKIRLGDERETTVGVYEVCTKQQTQLHHNRVQLRNMIAKECEKNTQQGALAAYYDNSGHWRFSFIAMEYTFNDDGGIVKEQTASKRFTYLLGQGAQTRTIEERFSSFPTTPSLDNLKEAFAVEPLNKDFYTNLYKWFERAVKEATFPKDQKESIPQDQTNKRNVIRLITRLLFIWFIKEKGLVEEKLFQEDQVEPLLKDYTKRGDSYYRAVLQNLFFATLNTEICKRDFNKKSRHTHRDFSLYRYKSQMKDPDALVSLFTKTPFINGGLFDCLDSFKATKNGGFRVDCFSDHRDHWSMLSIPNNLFFDNSENTPGLITIFQRYQFTVEESTPLDQDVALDPELLGKVFENLLASYNPETEQTARKATGSYYTPREIVSYMVDEGLKSYFMDLFPEAGEEKWSKLFAGKNPFGERQTLQIILSIDSLRILDPAVGSGAFPMEILRRLVGLLECLDPQNREFKQRQIDKADTMDDVTSRDTAIKDIEQIFSPKNDYNNYGRKLYLIQKCIYGVDIQPIACQIAKLRFFISLVIEQEPNSSNLTDNYGIRPLPNLETHFLAANSLVALKAGQSQFETPEVKDLQNKLKINRESHFHATNRGKKVELQNQYEELRVKLIEELKGLDFSKEVVDKIANWVPHDQNATADWFNAEYMFGIDTKDKKGFHIVLSNPPYIQLQKDVGRLANKYKGLGFKTFVGTGDIYCLFYEKGVELLKSGGHLCYITSNSWLQAAYGKNLRQFFSNVHSPLQLIEVGEDVFDNTIVDSSILLVKEGKHEQIVKAVDVGKIPKSDFPPKAEHWKGLYQKGGSPWFIGSGPEFALKKKIEDIGMPLREWDISINYGIKTGLNDAFIIDNETKERLIKEDPKSAEILKPILRGRDIKRYHCEAEWNRKWLIATLPSLRININDYPVIKKYLENFLPKLMQTGKPINKEERKRLIQRIESLGIQPKESNYKQCRKKTTYEWYETQDAIAYHSEFMRDKIVWKRVGSILRFSFDSKGVYALDSTCIATGKHLKVLLAILNSKVGHYLLRYAPKTGTGDLLISVQAMDLVLVPKITNKKQHLIEQIESQTDKILDDKNRCATSTFKSVEAEINNLVYQLYGLNNEDIHLIGQLLE